MQSSPVSRAALLDMVFPNSIRHRSHIDDALKWFRVHDFKDNFCLENKNVSQETKSAEYDGCSNIGNYILPDVFCCEACFSLTRPKIWYFSTNVML
jgi:hypothetical protein